MMYSHKILLALSLFFASCTNEADNTSRKPSETAHTTGSDTTSVGPPEPPTSCYRRISGRDTFSLQLLAREDKLSGSLVFDNYEKDSSHGTITGNEENGVLRLWYTFRSEGMTSVMQVFFKRSGSKLIHGIGNMDSRGDSSFFTNPASVQYPGEESWPSVHCADQYK
jgi:hypothetical protein